MCVCAHLSFIWFVYETVSLVLCMCASEVKGEGLERLCFCWESLWGSTRVYEGKIYCCSNLSHAQFSDIRMLFWMTFPPVSRLILCFHCCLSIETEERQRERWKGGEPQTGRQFLSFSLSPRPHPAFCLSIVDTLVCPKQDLSCLVEQGKPQGFCGGDSGVRVCVCVCPCVCLQPHLICVSGGQSGRPCAQTSGDRDTGWGMDLRHTSATLKDFRTLTHTQTHTHKYTHRASLKPIHMN